MAPTFDDLAADLNAETDALRSLLTPFDATQWSMASPAEGWTVKDQIAHLAYFDSVNALAASDSDKFVAMRAIAIEDRRGIVDGAAADARERDALDVDEWFRTERVAMIGAFRALPDGARVPWFGPDMSAASSMTARIMETWAHGQDVADALGCVLPPTRALRNVAHICARTMANSFRAHGLEVPSVDVRIELTAPDGSIWEWGSDKNELVVGSAVDFCLVGTQRRHVTDTDLVVHGEVAEQWMRIAQAFAGPPGKGRAASAQVDGAA